MTRLTVLVLPATYRAGAQACRSLAAAGHRVVGGQPRGRGAGQRIASCHRMLRYPSPGERPGDFVAAVAAFCADERVDVILPVADDVVRTLAPRSGVAGVPRVAGPTPDQYAALCDKAGLAAACAEAGVPHPATVPATGGEPQAGWPPLPAMVKSRMESAAAAAPRIATTAAERDGAVGAYRARGVESLVQELVPGRHWIAHCVRDGARLAVAATVTERQYPDGTGMASVCRLEDAPAPLADGAGRILALVDYRGPACLDFVERDGDFLLLDVNLRLGESVGAAVLAGLDQPALGVAAACGLGWHPPGRLGRGRYVWRDAEFARLASEVRGGDARGAGRTAALIGRGLLAPSTRVDPFPLGPRYVLNRTTNRSAATARRLVRAAGGGAR